MRSFLLHILLAFYILPISAQIYKQGQKFDDVRLVNNKIVFVKEISLPDNYKTSAYLILKDWGKSKFGTNPFVSSIKYVEKQKRIEAKSKIELILPENKDNVREKVLMYYRLNAYVDANNCIVEISDIKYALANAKELELAKKISAENFISNEALKINDELHELRLNTQKSTIFFINELTYSLEQQFGYK